MILTTHKNIPLVSKYSKPIVTDFIFPSTEIKKPILVFSHGYKGFKDWGPWYLMLKKIAEQNYFVVAFNFSHNGGTIENPIDFTDLESFGNDNFSKQQDDLQSIIDEITDENFKFSNHVDTSKICLIGHSRGGGATIIKASNEPKITHLISLASISTYDTSFLTGSDLEQWKNTGVWHIINGRTQQKMPHYIQFYEDYQANKAELNISVAAEKLNIPHLIIHGTEDTSVTFEHAEKINNWSKKSELFSLKTDHVFNAKHPWESDQMPEALNLTTQKIIEFLN